MPLRLGLPARLSGRHTVCSPLCCVSTGDFMLRYVLEKGQLQHFPLLLGQAGEGFRLIYDSKGL